MRTPETKRLALLAILCLCISTLLSACGSSPPSRYYTLEEQIGTKTSIAEEPLAVRVGPIKIARYLNRPQFVTRMDRNELKVAEYNRWIEPLDQSFQRILTNNLGDDLGSPLVHEFGSVAIGDPLLNYRVVASLMRFDVDQNDTATLDVQWALTGKDQDNLYVAERSVYTGQAGSKSYSDQASAMSNLIAEFSRTIADNIVLIETEEARWQNQTIN